MFQHRLSNYPEVGRFCYSPLTTVRGKGIAFDEECKVFEVCKPVQMLSALSQDAALVQVAKEVEEKTIQMVDEAK